MMCLSAPCLRQQAEVIPCALAQVSLVLHQSGHPLIENWHLGVPHYYRLLVVVFCSFVGLV